MEKASDNNNNPTKLSNMLQKALSIGHGATPFSPVRDFHHHHRTASTVNRGFFFSGPITPLLPTAAARARRRTKNAVVYAEPTSPKVSCIGQIKLSKCPETKNGERRNLKTASYCLVKGNWLKLKRLFSVGLKKPNYTAVSAASKPSIAAVEAVTAPSLCKMKKFASSREALVGFDWTVEMKREESSRSDHHRRGYSSDDKEKMMIPCSVSMPLAQREGVTMCPREKSEVNLWKRRTMDRPKPLQVKATY